jgi:hypothetical protein
MTGIAEKPHDDFARPLKPMGPSANARQKCDSAGKAKEPPTTVCHAEGRDEVCPVLSVPQLDSSTGVAALGRGVRKTTRLPESAITDGAFRSLAGIFMVGQGGEMGTELFEDVSLGLAEREY